jgi:two-component system, NtrC family, response regulator
MPGTILIIDDDSSVITSLSLLLKQAGYRSQSATSMAQALEIFKNDKFDLVLQDMNFSRQTSGEEGLSLLRQIKSQQPGVPVILMTAWGSISLAVEGIKAGAADFITKPWTNEQLLHSIRTALELAAASGNDAAPSANRAELDKIFDFGNIIGQDPKIFHILQIIARVCATDASVLITGESGTGKELIAEAIHRNSHRRNKPFIKVNLGGVSSTLFESEMFGHVKGAFTDARQDRKGRFEMAHVGTIFLDEIGDIDTTSQVKLLRVLQDRTYEVLGSSVTRTVDVRVISATNANLMELIEAGKFREDLLYRLNLIAIHVPPLRERRNDIPLLALHFLKNIGNIYRRTNLSINPEALRWLEQLPWPGNIRQFRQTIERAVLITSNDTLEVDDFKTPLTMDTSRQGLSPEKLDGNTTLEEMERTMIIRYMQQFNGNISKVADAMGLSRAALYRRLEKFGISP